MLLRIRTRLAPTLGGLILVAGLAGAPAASASILDGCLGDRSVADLNGDGFDDAAVGDPLATVDGQAEAGTVTVLFGDADGRIGEGVRRVLTQADLGETPEAGDHFGWDVVLGLIDQDAGCAGIVIGAPGEDVDGHVDAGMVHIVSYATDDEGAPTTVSAYNLTQADGGGVVEAGDEFGSAVAITGPTFEDPRRVIVGAPGETIGTAHDAGAVNIFRFQGSPTPLTQLYQGKVPPLGKKRIPGTPQTGDRFGASLAVGLLDLPDKSGGGLNQGLIIGAPGDTVAGHAGAGSITVIQEEFESATLITQDSPGVPGVAEGGDHFGASLALSTQVGHIARTLAVGAPGEDGGTISDTGSVTLFLNTKHHFVARTAITEATSGVPGTAEAGDHFGASLVYSSDTTLLIGAPDEDLGAVVDAGDVQPVRNFGPTFALQFPATITEDAENTPGSVGTGHHFGYSLGALSGVRERIATISSLESLGSVYVLSDGHTEVDGSHVDLPPRAWAPGSDGIPSDGNAGFGGAVTN